MPVWGPTKWYYALALAGIAVSVFALYFFVERRSAAIADDLTRVIVPAESSVTLAATSPISPTACPCSSPARRSQRSASGAWEDGT